MADKPLFYAVSFGDSEKYRVDETPDMSVHRRLEEVEYELRSYLKTLFPEETFAYFVTPKVEEVYESNLSEYGSIKPLDDEAVEAIKKVLANGVRDMNSVNALDSDAPFASINPDALG